MFISRAENTDDNTSVFNFQSKYEFFDTYVLRNDTARNVTHILCGFISIFYVLLLKESIAHS